MRDRDGYHTSMISVVTGTALKARVELYCISFAVAAVTVKDGSAYTSGRALAIES